MQGYTQNCDYFSFIKYSGPSSYNGFSTINAVEYSEASGIVIDKVKCIPDRVKLKTCDKKSNTCIVDRRWSASR